MSTKKVAPVKEAAKEKSLNLLDKATILNHFAQSKNVMLETVDSVTNKLVQGLDELQDLDNAIAAKTEALKELNQIEVEAETLAKLKASQDETRKEWQREQADYTYKLNRDRNIEVDQWKQASDKRNREFNAELAKTKTSLEEEVKVFHAQKQELEDLRAKVAAFPAELQQAVTAKEKEVTKSLETSHHFKSTILEKDKNSELALLKQTNEAQKVRIVELEKALEEARNLQKDAVSRVQSIAEKAIEGASKHQTVVMPTQESGNNLKK